MKIGSSTPRGAEATGPRGESYSSYETLELPRRHDVGWWNRPGLSPRGERALEIVGAVVLLVLAIGWGWSLTHVRTASAATRELGAIGGGAAGTITSALTNANAPTTAYLTNAALTVLADRMLAGARGASGKLKVTIEPTPAPIRADTLPSGTTVGYSQGGGPVSAAPTGAGLWNVVLAVGNGVRQVADFHVITMLPFSTKTNGHIGTYYVGTWPAEHGAKGPSKAPAGEYANPAGFIEVTEANRNTPVSEHFKLGDFVTHDQPNVWPKYIVLQQKLLDKLELVLSDLQARGYDVRGVRVMSGFRSPEYNYTGGNTAGRAELSRHMFGDASDIYIDSDGDGQMDDLNHDGRISIDDARVILQSVDRVEAAHPELVGGAGVYTAAPGHGPFIHIDTRGYRARWVGTSGG